MMKNKRQLIIKYLIDYLLGLNSGFAFAGQNKPLPFNKQRNKIDIVFYHVKLKCLILIVLKFDKLNHEDTKKINTYFRIYDEQHNLETDNPTIGLVLCSNRNETIAKYSVPADDEQLFAKYLPYLPTEEELAKELQRERALLSEMDNQDE